MTDESVKPATDDQIAAIARALDDWTVPDDPTVSAADVDGLIARIDAERAAGLYVEVQDLRARCEALERENAALTRWSCSTCGARFSSDPPSPPDPGVSLQGVVRCSACAENADLARIAGEALGTDEEYQTARGCVEALAGWCGNLQRETAEAWTEIAELRKRLEALDHREAP